MINKMAIDKERLMNDFNSFLKQEMTEEQFVNNLALTYTSKELAVWIYTKLLEEAQTGFDNKIVITQTEFKKLLSIFKIKGIKGFKPNGEMIIEGRGSTANRPDKLF